MQRTTVENRTAFDEAALGAYWRRLSRDYLDRDAESLATICFAGMPLWFNRFMHRYQLKAFRRLVAGQSFAGARVLDVGTGTGRWARWYAQWPASRVTGIDIEPARLARAASLGGGVTYEEMPADALTLADAAFDVVNCITVLQHIPDEARRRAIGEIARVLRPGGRAVVFELTDPIDDAPHVFPWSVVRWKQEFDVHGLRPRRTVGEQYIPLLRVLKRAHGAVRRGGARGEIDALKSGRDTPVDRMTMLALRAATVASYPIEEVCRFMPPAAARITGFLFVKDDPANQAP
jgi:ubiquinone/menaquinone biosynthesis C-methylase UbiE